MVYTLIPMPNKQLVLSVEQIRLFTSLHLYRDSYKV